MHGGLVFIPHIFEYKENSIKILNEILNNYEIDGLECYYTTFTEEQSKFVLNTCKERNLFISGGSDYHGSFKPNVEMAIGMGNLKVTKEIVEPWIGKVL